MTTTRPATALAAVRVPERSIVADLRAIRIVWQRDIIRFLHERSRIAASLLSPLLYLLVFGAGLTPIISDAVSGIDFRQFMFSGMLVMTVLYTGMFSAGSIVFDREFGFLREMLVAPVRRGAIVLGKCLSGATIATSQGIVVIGFAGLVGVPYHPVLILTLVAELLLLSFSLTALGVMMATLTKGGPTFMAVSQLFLMPLFFLSGALFPLGGLPSWLQLLTRLNPLTYAVDPMRDAVFGYLDVSPEAAAAFNPGVSWFGWHVPVALELAIVAVMGAGMLVVGARQFNREE
ncbi:ABC transporter permease [Virgisporangium aurantiacum]|uniref:Transport permease protein n=1 Tax=Virgisporangium aurantiacum TaxID=175570 RepID=A0A8J3ZAV6_9ACTN|nr:ABC transporter permease [Virgisporangium aurantiacum]GIJ60407.1 transport permease protein [Virgisporangium aurantiacum]